MPLSESHKRFLHAMGIQAWDLRHAQSPAENIPVVDEPVAITQPVTESQVFDINPVTDMDWKQLEQSVLACQGCALHETRTQAVFGVGNKNAQWMVIGEAPGAEEDRQGEPFVGRAGQLLNNMLMAMGLKREEIYIGNILKCRPPNNRDPKPEEVEQCEQYLFRQVDLIRPKIILAVGRIAAQNLLKTDSSLARLRNQTFGYGEQEIPLVVTYHPAYLLRSPGEKRKAWQDLQYAMRVYHARK